MRLSLFLLLFAFISQLSAQQDYLFSTRTYSAKDGLLSDRIHAIHKDARGFMWIGTEEGLNRFDGQEFKSFSKNTHPEMSIKTIHRIIEDAEGYLWLLEANETYEFYFLSPEINLFNINTGEITTLEERFGRELPFEVKDIRYINKIRDESIFIFTNKGNKGFYYRPDKGFEPVNLPENVVAVNGVVLQKNGNLLLEGRIRSKNDSNEWHVYLIDENGEILSQRKTDFTIPLKTENQNFQARLEGTYFVIGGQNIEGYNLLNPDLSKKTEAISDFDEHIDFTKWNPEQELLWLKSGTMIRAAKRSGEIVYEQKDKLDFLDIPMLFDGNTTWLSNKREGLVAITLEPNYFQTYQFFEHEFDNSTRGIFVTKDGEIFTSTIAGTARLDKNGYRSAQIRKDGMLFTRFMKDKTEGLWSMGSGGLFRYDLETEENQFYKVDRAYHSWSMFESDNGDIWLCGNREIFSFNPQTKETTLLSEFLSEYQGEFNIYEFSENTDGTVWLCTNQGLFHVDAKGKYLGHYNDSQSEAFYLPANDFHHLYEDKEGVIWLATGDAGLIEWNPNNPSNTQAVVKQYTKVDGLSSNALHAVYEDDFGYLWISSDNGLMQFDKKSKQVFKYLKENGIPHNEFNRIAHYQKEDGQLFFGGITGMIQFHPKNFADSRKQQNEAPLAIADYSQYSEDKEAFENLTFDLIENNTITLDPNSRFFNLNLALLDFKQDHQTTYSYRIKGVYDWQTTRNKNLNISGLPYGKHILELKAQDGNQQKAANELAITVNVLRPFYLRIWFLILAIATLGVCIFFFVRWRTKQLVIVKEAEQLRNLDSMKSRFFANISHELRTPITLILAPLGQFIKNNPLSKEQKQELLSVQNNGKNLLNLVNEVLDLSKLEVGKLELNSRPTKIPQFIERVVANFESAALSREIEYQFMSFLTKDIVADFDKSKLESIFNNLLSNALKFTSREGMIRIIVTQVEEDLIVRVKDNGRGISADDLPHVFDRYFQSSHNLEGGTGIGLALTKELVELMDGEIIAHSTIDEGTEFEVKLPILYSDKATIDNQEEEEISSFKYLEIQDAKENLIRKQETILLVEDNRSLQRFVKSILVPFYNVEIAENGQDALDKLEGKQGVESIIPNLILSDVMMPGMDGFTFLNKVKTNDAFCSIPFVLLTARADMQDKLHGLRIGVDDYVTKPFEVEELLLRIRNLLRNVKARREGDAETENSSPDIKEIENQESEKKEHLPSASDLLWLSKVEALAKREINNKQFTLEDMARELLMSQRNMARKIKQITGLSPNRYIRTIRLEIARRILETEDIQTLKEVSYAVGFENITYFSKQFKDQYGKHPSEYL